MMRTCIIRPSPNILCIGVLLRAVIQRNEARMGDTDAYIQHNTHFALSPLQTVKPAKRHQPESPRPLGISIYCRRYNSLAVKKGQIIASDTPGRSGCTVHAHTNSPAMHATGSGVSADITQGTRGASRARGAGGRELHGKGPPNLIKLSSSTSVFFLPSLCLRTSRFASLSRPLSLPQAHINIIIFALPFLFLTLPFS